MFCDECKSRPATVHITKIINNDKTEINLCEDCAKNYQHEFGFGFDSDFSIHKFLTGLLATDGFESGLEKGIQNYLRCETCGVDYMQFQQTGRMGCANCYDTYGNNLNMLLKRVHGSNMHNGKYPKRSGFDLRIKQEIKNLRETLQTLIATEEFEKAAEVRDKIRELEKSIEEKGE